MEQRVPVLRFLVVDGGLKEHRAMRLCLVKPIKRLFKIQILSTEALRFSWE